MTIDEAREYNEDQRDFINKLSSLMLANPDLPVEWVTPSATDGYDWMGGYQFCACTPYISVETIARGWRHHVIIKGETKATQMDDPEDPSLEWYRAIVVRMS